MLYLPILSIRPQFLIYLLVLDRNLDGDDSATGAGDQRLFYHQDSLYSVFALTDEAGNVVEGYQYDAYGRPTVFSPGANGVVDFGGDDAIVAGGSSVLSNPYLRTGHRFDPETKLYYYGYRYHSPTLGRWVSRDPIEEAGGLNIYAMSHNNTVNRIDLYGLDVVKCCPDETKKDKENYNDCVAAVGDYINKQEEALRKAYKLTIETIDKESARLQEACKSKFNENKFYYDFLVYQCQLKVRVSAGAQKGAAYTTLETGKAALALASLYGMMKCGNMYPCHTGFRTTPTTGPGTGRGPGRGPGDDDGRSIPS